MNQPDSNRPSEPLEAYFDRLIDEQVGGGVESASADAFAPQADMQLQQRIDRRLTQMYGFQPPPLERVVATLVAANAETWTSRQPSSSLPSRIWWAVAVAVAASIAWMTLNLLPADPPPATPLFAATPLVVLYRDALQNGFEPYYECREPDRFADTFARRQRQPLKLAPLPLGASMLGLSYPGGLSRDTTAMLCRVDGQPVMVFVDQLAVDQPQAAAGAGDGLHVFRVIRDGLVFYEVTPLDEPRMIDYLVPTEGYLDATR